jgi:hypothetical protein
MDTTKERVDAQRGRGRPKASDPGISLCTRVPTSEYDRLVRMANQRETSVSALVRQMLVLRLPSPKR